MLGFQSVLKAKSIWDAFEVKLVDVWYIFTLQLTMLDLSRDKN